MWWVDISWLPDTHPASLIPPPQSDGGRKQDEKAYGLR